MKTLLKSNQQPNADFPSGKDIPKTDEPNVSCVPLGVNGKPLKGRKLKKYQKTERKIQIASAKADEKAAKARLKEVKAQDKKLGIEARIKAESKAQKDSAKTQQKEIRKAKNAIRVLGYEKIYEDGICEVRPGVYSRCIAFGDASYQTSREEEQKMMLNHVCWLLNVGDEATHIQLMASNNPVPREEFAASMMIGKDAPTGLEDLAREYDEMIASKCAEQEHTMQQERCYVVTVTAPDIDKARRQLGTVTNSIEEQLRACKVPYHVMTGLERIESIHQVLRPKEPFDFDYEDAYFSGLTSKDYVSPHSFDFKPKNHAGLFRFGDKYGYIMYLRRYPSNARDNFLSELLDLSLPMHVSVHYQAMEPDKAERAVTRKYAFMDQQRAHDAKIAARSGLDPSFVSRSLTTDMAECNSLLNDLQTTEQKLFYTSFFVMLWDDTEEGLEESVYEVSKLVNKTAKLEPMTMAPLKRLALNSVLPIGIEQTEYYRILTTTEAAIMTIPFAQIRINDAGGAYYGVNASSSEIVAHNRKLLTAPMGWVLAMPGRGKSFLVKREIFATLALNPDDEVIVIDPQNEYSYLVEELGGQVVQVDPASTTTINPFDMDSKYAGEGVNPLAFKSSFVITMISTLVNGDVGIDTIQQGIVDRCVRATYANYDPSWTVDDMPTFEDFYKILKEQAEPEAKALAKALELYVEGTLSVFNARTNVKTSSRLISYNTKALPDALKTLGMLVVLDQVNNRAAYNFARGVRTWLYIDEAQNYFTNTHSINYFDKTFSEGRKNLVIPTAITQNVDRVIIHDRARQMLSNSDFMVLLGQSHNDLTHLTEIVGLSAKEQEHLLTDTPGQGIVKAGSRRVCIKDKFPKDTKLYELFSTDPNEREERFRAAKRTTKAANKVA